VIEGKREGRRLGFPTINLPLHPRSPLLSGIYAVRVADAASSVQAEYDGVAYVSERPNGAAPKRLLEVHIFNFDEDWYGRRVRVDLHAYLREGRRFDSEEALRHQIAADADQARSVLQDLGSM
jgi:riboflavin kinase/FMN adenylyltransferase